MLASFVLVLREGLEAALIIGITLGVLSKMKRSRLAHVVWLGAGAAALLSVGAAIALHRLELELQGAAEPIFEGLTLLLAAGVVTWMILWMMRQGRQVRNALEAQVQTAANRGQRWGLFLVAFIAVLREGIETAIFLVAAALTTTATQTLVGALAGLAVAAFLGWILFVATVRLDVHRFFLVTGALLILFAAGLVAQGVHELNEVGWIPAVVEHLWDFSPWISATSTLGQALKTLFGYNPAPSLTEFIAYVAYFLAVLVGLPLAGRKSRPSASSVKA